MQTYRKNNELISMFSSFLILIFSFLISTDIASVSGFLRVVDVILFFVLLIIGVVNTIKILRGSFMVHNWKTFMICISVLTIYLCLLIKVFIILRG